MAMVPRPLTQERSEEALDAIEVVESDSAMIWPVRLTLLSFAVVFAVILGMAVWLNPYQGNRTWTQATHTQLGLPPCSFYQMTGLPCPSCGMTTSFALLVRGDVIHSMKANWVGTALATLCVLYIPWSLISVLRGRSLFFESVENVLTRLIMGFLWLLVVRWCVVLLLLWRNGLW